MRGERAFPAGEAGERRELAFLVHPSYDVAVVGAGVLGASAALALLRRGARRVVVFEKDLPASGSTAKAAGIVSLLTWDATDAKLVAASQRAYREAARRYPGRFRYQEGGMLAVVSDARDVEPMARRVAMLREAGVDVEEPSPDAALSRWPDLELGDALGLWYTPADGRVLAPDYVALACEEIRAEGGEIRRDDPVLRVEVGDGRATGVVAASGRVAAGRVLVAAGVWTRRLLLASDPSLDIPLKPYRTQLAVVAAPDPLRVPILHDLTLGFYWIPEGNRLLFGDGTEERESDPDAYDEGNDPDFLLSLAERLPRRLRGGREARYLRGWAGLCDATPDRRPLLGPHPAVAGLFLACGTNGFGVMRAPALGEAAAALALGEDPGLDLSALLPSRFPGWFDFPIRQGFNTAG